MADAKKVTMDELLANAGDSIKKAATGDVVSGTVLSVKKHEILIDLGAQGVGLVPRREASFARNLEEGAEVTASVIDSEMEDGMVLLSLRKAVKDKGWDEIQAKLDASEIVEVTPFDANKKDNKLIFSEKEAVKDGLAARFAELHVGDTVEGVVTGVVDFGVFVNVEGIEGLVHISEISWERVNNPSDYVKVGDTIKAKIIAIDKERLSLSIKQLVADPWLSEVENLKKGSKVEGTVTRITPFGAFVQISPAVEALVHVSELGEGNDVDPEKIFTLNERKNFKVLDIDREGRKISLSVAK